MADYYAQFILRTTDDNPTNFCVNTWSIDALEVAILEDAETAIVDFYNTIPGIFPNTIQQNGNLAKWYLRTDVKPNYPVREATWNFSVAPNGNPLPSEASICLSFQGQRNTGQPQARKRGRVYLGPLDTSTLANDGRPDSTFTAAIAAAAGNLLADSQAAANWKWQVFSSVNGTGVDVVDGWVDNSFDTQRRRGLAWTQRATF